MQRDVSKGTHDWAVLPTAIVSPGHVGATSFYDNSMVAGGWNRVEGAEGALNVTARLKPHPQISRASRGTAPSCRCLEQNGPRLRINAGCIGAQHCGT
jgi:hypothetical protein